MVEGGKRFKGGDVNQQFYRVNITQQHIASAIPNTGFIKSMQRIGTQKELYRIVVRCNDNRNSSKVSEKGRKKGKRSRLSRESNSLSTRSVATKPCRGGFTSYLGAMPLVQRRRPIPLGQWTEAHVMNGEITTFKLHFVSSCII